MHHHSDNIIARSTPPGRSAIAVIRMSGPDVFELVGDRAGNKKLKSVPAKRELLFSTLYDDKGQLIDEVVLACFPGPNSYTGENVIEISCHGSNFIVQQIIEQFVRDGVRPAGPGEFTMRAFFNGKMDLARAEGVIDLIDSENKSQHQLAIGQLRGGFSDRIAGLRDRLIHFASLIELELDFGEEDVEFADRVELEKSVIEINAFISDLIASFSMGNAIKNGISTVIAGRPNAGKSTLLNAIIEEERAIVSDVEGTTRDAIEEVIHLDGVAFRLIDTAGIREAGDIVEEMGIKRTLKKIEDSAILIYLFDLSATSVAEVLSDLKKVERPGIKVITVGNKADLVTESELKEVNKKIVSPYLFLAVSAAEKKGLEELKALLVKHFHELESGQTDTVLHNSRHYNALLRCRESLEKVIDGLKEGVPADLVAMDIRHAMVQLNAILGRGISSDDLLQNIFSRFCIGK